MGQFASGFRAWVRAMNLPSSIERDQKVKEAFERLTAAWLSDQSNWDAADKLAHEILAAFERIVCSVGHDIVLLLRSRRKEVVYR